MGGQHVHFAFQIRPEEYDNYLALIKSCGLEPLEHIWETGQKAFTFLTMMGTRGIYDDRLDYA